MQYKMGKDAVTTLSLYGICREFHWLPSKVMDEPAPAIQELMILHSVFSAKQSYDMEQLEAQSKRHGKH
jgi:hypothetical protein